MPVRFGRTPAFLAIAAIAALTFGCESTTHEPPADAGAGVDGGAADTGAMPDVRSAADASAVTIVEQVVGDDPAFVLPDVLLLTSQDEADAAGVPIALTDGVDWDAHAMVVVAMGRRSTGGYWARIAGVQQVGDTVYVQGLANAPGPDDMVTQAITHPFAAAKIEPVDADKVRADITSVTGQRPPADIDVSPFERPAAPADDMDVNTNAEMRPPADDAADEVDEDIVNDEPAGVMPDLDDPASTHAPRDGVVDEDAADDLADDGANESGDGGDEAFK